MNNSEFLSAYYSLLKGKLNKMISLSGKELYEAGANVLESIYLLKTQLDYSKNNKDYLKFLESIEKLIFKGIHKDKKYLKEVINLF